MSDNKEYIVFLGETGVGKTRTFNKITNSNFTSMDSDSSVTQNIQMTDFGRYCWVDTPGFFDETENEERNRLKLIDFLKNKKVKCFLFIYTNRVNIFIEKFLDQFLSRNEKKIEDS